MRYLTGLMLLCGLALAAEPAAGPTEMDRKEAEAFAELARQALAGGKAKEAAAWLDKAEAKCPMPAIWELRGHGCVRAGEKEKAVRYYLRARDAYRSVDKAGFARVNGELALLSPGLMKYLDTRDKFLGQAKLAMAGYGQDEITKGLATSDVEALDAVLAGRSAPARTGPAGTDAPDPAALSAETVGKLFRGRVLGFDPEKLSVELRYDFENEADLGDWGLHPEARAKLQDGTLVLFGRDGLWREEKARLRPYLRLPVTVSLTMRNATEKLGELSVGLRAGATGETAGIGLGTHSNKKGSTVNAWGQKFALQDLGPVEAGRAYAVQLEITPALVRVTVNGKEMLRREVKAPDDWFRLALNTDESCSVAYDEIVISGTLDRAALEEALKKGALPPAGTLQDPATRRGGPAPQPAGPRTLFNGQDLQGWTASEGWTVEDGAITWKGAPPKLGWVTLASTQTQWNYQHFRVTLQARGTFREVGLRTGWETFAVPTKGEPSTWHTIAIEVQGETAKVTADGEAIHEGALKGRVSELALWAKGASGLPKDTAAFRGIRLEILKR